MNRMRILSLQNTLETAKGLLGSGYKVQISLESVERDIDDIWLIRNYNVDYQDEGLDFFPSSLDSIFKYGKGYNAASLEELFEGYEGDYPEYELDLFEEMGIRKD